MIENSLPGQQSGPRSGVKLLDAAIHSIWLATIVLQAQQVRQSAACNKFMNEQEVINALPISSYVMEPDFDDVD